MREKFEDFVEDEPNDNISLGVTELFNKLALMIDDLEGIQNKHYNSRKRNFYSKEEASQISKKVRIECTSLLSALDDIDNIIKKN